MDAHCRERFIELIPNQNSFGHLRAWLKHPEYLPLAEVSQGFDAPWGSMLRHACRRGILALEADPQKAAQGEAELNADILGLVEFRDGFLIDVICEIRGSSFFIPIVLSESLSARLRTLAS